MFSALSHRVGALSISCIIIIIVIFPCAVPYFMNCPHDLVVLDVDSNSKTVHIKLDLKAKDCKGDQLDVMLSDDVLVAGVGEENFHLLSATSARDGKGNFAECIFHVRVRGQEGYIVTPPPPTPHCPRLPGCWPTCLLTGFSLCL